MRGEDGLLDPHSFAYLLHASDQAGRVGSPLAAAPPPVEWMDYEDGGSEQEDGWEARVLWVFSVWR
jgi:hypothetical protein